MKPHMKHRSHSGGNQKIRYGLSFGKLADPTEEVAYEMALDSVDTYTREHDGVWATYIGIDKSDAGFLRTFYSSWGFLNRAERQDILKNKGFILWEDSQGFVYIKWYADRDNMMDEWRELAANYSGEDGSEWEDSPNTQ